MPTLTALVSEEFIKEIDTLPNRLDRSRAWVVKEAVREYLDRRNREQERWNETLEAIAAADRGEVIPAEDALDWIDTWGQPRERRGSDT